MKDTLKTPERIWREQADADINASSRAASHAAGAERASFRATGPAGALILALARRRLFSYAIADAPKLSWLERALAGTGPLTLDVGVRTGDLAAFLQTHGKRVFGIDIAGAYVDHCQAAGIIEGGGVCNVETDRIPGPGEFVPGLPSQYDVVFIGEVLEHLLDGRKVIRKLGEVIRPGGALILTTPNLAYLGNRVRLLLGKDLHPLTIDRGEVGHQHIRVYTARLLKHMLCDAGLRTVMVGSDGVISKLSKYLALADSGQVEQQAHQDVLLQWPLTSWPFPTLGRTIFVKAIKG